MGFTSPTWTATATSTSYQHHQVTTQVAWYENNGAAYPSFSGTDIDTNADGAKSVYVADMDGDGDLDIVSASSADDTIAWYETEGAAALTDVTGATCSVSPLSQPGCPSTAARAPSAARRRSRRATRPTRSPPSSAV